MIRVAITRSFIALALCLSWLQVLHAQSTTTGYVTGVVTDPSKAVVPAATVSVKNKGTSFGQTVTTSADGAYRIAFVPPGDYDLTVT